MGERRATGEDGLEETDIGEGDLEDVGEAGGELAGVERGDNSSME